MVVPGQPSQHAYQLSTQQLSLASQKAPRTPSTTAAASQNPWHFPCYAHCTALSLAEPLECPCPTWEPGCIFVSTTRMPQRAVGARLTPSQIPSSSTRLLTAQVLPHPPTPPPWAFLQVHRKENQSLQGRQTLHNSKVGTINSSLN